MNRILNIISLTASFSVVMAVLILIQEYTIGQIGGFRKIILTDTIPLRFLLYPIVAIILIVRFFKFHIPNRQS
ncbi:hypothetical protein D7Z94_16060 [Ulvibacterium marinum]|uniref:DUF2798 domain-containing protein n=1 Tax=Ulvibacterium marinum TaxID=2419782 RepID=A0A3B0C1S7_9FLAO|nr:hypothetical protein D7Z94_16060 [Ulvibacterium marinum]